MYEKETKNLFGASVSILREVFWWTLAGGAVVALVVGGVVYLIFKD